MKRVVIFFLVFLSFKSFGQYLPLGSPGGNNISGVNAINALQMPRGADTPAVANIKGLLKDSVGMLFFKTADNTFWLRVQSTGTINKWTQVGSGGGGSGLTTASNGLTAVGSDVRLGGTLTQNTAVAGATFELSFTGLSLFKIGSGDVTNMPVPLSFESIYTSTNTTGASVNGIFRANQTAGNASGSIQGVEGYVTTNSTSLINTAIGAIGNVEQKNTGTLSEARGLQGGVIVTANGNVSKAKSIYSNPPTFSGATSSTIDSAFGIYVDLFNSSAGTGTFTNKYNIFTADAGGKNYFKGQTSIVDGTQANNYVFKSDANGNGSWANVNTLITTPTLQTVTDAGNTTTNDIIIGADAALLSANGTHSVIFGTVGFLNMGDNATIMGYSAGGGNTGSSLSAFGNGSGANNTGRNVTAIGSSAAANNTADGVTGLGSQAASNNTGENVVAIGEVAGANNTFSNVIILGGGAEADADKQLSLLFDTRGIRYNTDNIPDGNIYNRSWANASGNEVLSVNGNTANSSGDITLTVPAAGVTTMAAIGSSPNANGATISGVTLTLQPASASFGGVLTTASQSIAGAKTFTTDLVAGDISGGNFVQLDATNGIINVGSSTTYAKLLPTRLATLATTLELGTMTGGFSAFTSKATFTSGALTISSANLLFSSDNTLDIGATGATRPRTGYFGTSIISPLVNGLTITNNGTNTLNIVAGGSLITAGAFATTLTSTGTTNVTLPTSGTLLTTTGSGTGLTGVALLATANTFTTNGAVSASSQVYSGSVFTGGTGTTTTPFMLFNPTGTTAASIWSTSGTYLGMNAVSGFGGNLLHLLVNNSAKFTVTSAGTGTFGGNLIASGTSSTSVSFRNDQNAFGTTSTDGLILANTTSGTNGAPIQYSHRARFTGNAWTGAASQQSDFFIENEPVNGTNPITANLVIKSQINSGGYTNIFQLNDRGKISQLTTITAGGTTGAQTINKPTGTVNFAAAATSLVVTNSLVTTSSTVFAVVRTGDATAYIKNVVPASGSFTITLGAAATAETSVGFWVIN